MTVILINLSQRRRVPPRARVWLQNSRPAFYGLEEFGAALLLYPEIRLG